MVRLDVSHTTTSRMCEMCLMRTDILVNAIQNVYGPKNQRDTEAKALLIINGRRHERAK